MKKSIITIEFTPGSKFQEDSALNSLSQLLAVWIRQYQNKHRDNKIKITMKCLPIYK